VAVRALARVASRAPVPVFAVAGIGARTALLAVRADDRVTLASSPRHATVLLVGGAVTDRHAETLAHDQLPGPRAAVWWGGDDTAALGISDVVPVAASGDAIAVVVRVHDELLSGRRRSSPPIGPATSPVSWRGVGPHGQGGEGMMGGQPYGRPMAMTGPDLRDGLQLDRMSLPVGPALPGLPPGLGVVLELQGDVIQQVELAADPFASAAAIGSRLPSVTDVFDAAMTQPVPIAELELARARIHLLRVADALALYGLAAAARRTARLALRLVPAYVTRMRRLRRWLRRTTALWGATSGVGRIDADVARDVGLSGLAARAAGLPTDARADAAADVRTGIVVFGAVEVLTMVAVYLHGWSANSYLALIGGYRFLAVVLSTLLISMFVLIAAALPAESLSFGAIVDDQAGLWNVVRQPLGLPLWLVVGLATAFWGPFELADGADLAGGTAAETSGRHRLAWAAARRAMLVAYAVAGAAVFLGTEHLIVVGGGFIGCEFAQMFSRFGAKVTIVQRGDRLLSAEDPDVSTVAGEAFSGEGIDVVTGTACVAVADDGERIRITCEGAEVSELIGSHLLIATGRTPNTDDLGLEHLDVTLDRRGYLPVDDRLHTDVDDVWSLGDLHGEEMFTHTARDDADTVYGTAFKGQDRTIADRVVPHAVFLDPEVAAVGLTEQQARDAGYAVAIGRQEFSDVAKARAIGRTAGHITFVADADTDRILGCHIVGPDAGNLVHEAVIAMVADAPYSDIGRAIHIHPTLAEGVNSAAGGVHRPSSD
jgi:hypothetical protein